MTAPVLEISNLETFYGPVMALRGVSLQVPKGQIATILGANGAGKSTLLKTVSGVMEPRKGEILLDGEAIHGREPDAIVRAGIAHVPEGREVFPFLTVAENLLMGAFLIRSTTISRPSGSGGGSPPERCRADSSKCWRSDGA